MIYCRPPQYSQYPPLAICCSVLTIRCSLLAIQYFVPSTVFQPYSLLILCLVCVRWLIYVLLTTGYNLRCYLGTYTGERCPALQLMQPCSPVAVYIATKTAIDYSQLDACSPSAQHVLSIRSVPTHCSLNAGGRHLSEFLIQSNHRLD